MKTNTLLLLVATLTFSFIGTAQNETDLSELLDRLHGNHMGSIYDVFTVEEVAQLRVHFDSQNTTTPLRYGGGDMPIRAIENTKGNLSNIHRDNLSTIELVAPSPLTEFEGAGATIPGTAGAVVADNSNNFYEVNSFGEYTVIGTIQPASGQSFTGLEYTSDGVLFGIATDGMGSTAIYRINTVAGTATPVGGSNGLVVGIALGRDMNNNLYSYDIDTDLLHRIDKDTGEATVVGPIGFDAEFGQGMSYDSSTNTLLATVFNSDTFKPELRSFNTTTGASSNLGTIVPSQTLQLSWMSVFDPTLGVDDTAVSQFTVFPNPATDILTITSKVTIESVAIYNTLGQLVLEQPMNDLTGTIAISKLPSGLFFVRIGAQGSQEAVQFIRE